MGKCHRNCGHKDSKFLDIAWEIGSNVTAIAVAENLDVVAEIATQTVF